MQGFCQTSEEERQGPAEAQEERSMRARHFQTNLPRVFLRSRAARISAN